jgi:tetratricopeptide (TPR) repeat protein
LEESRVNKSLSQRHLVEIALAGSLLLGLGGIVSWVHLPLEGQVSGLRLALWQPWFGQGFPAYHIFSFGGMSLLLSGLLLGVGLTPLRRRPILWLVFGLGAWLLVIVFLLHLANRLEDLTYIWDQRCQLEEIISFVKVHHLATAYAMLPTYGTYLPLDLRPLSLPERIIFNLDFISWGMLLIPLAGGLIWATGFFLLDSSQKARGGFLMALSLCVLASPLVWYGVARDRQLQQADSLLARGHFQKAINKFEQLGENYPDLWCYPPYLYSLGDTYNRLNKESFVRHFFLGAKSYLETMSLSQAHATTGAREAELARSQQQFSLAAASPNPLLNRTSRLLWGWALVFQGLEGFKKRPSIALPYLAQAQNISGWQLQASFYLGQAQLEIRSTTDAYKDLSLFLKSCQESFPRSKALTFTGDANYQDKNFQAARDNYEQALRAYHYMNFPPLKGLSGR